jgi:hypothetical protein
MTRSFHRFRYWHAHRTRVPIFLVRVVRPAWWYYPEQCENGHEWRPGRVLVSFTRCNCRPVRAAYGKSGGLGHLTVACREPGVHVGVAHPAARAGVTRPPGAPVIPRGRCHVSG